MENVAEERQWSTASLRIQSSVISGTDITNTLLVQPTICRNRGDLISTHNPQSKRRTSSVWILDSELDRSLPIESHLEKIVDFVEKNVDRLIPLVSQSTISIFCGFSSTEAQSSFILSTKILKQLNVIPLEIIFDLYFPYTESENN